MTLHAVPPPASPIFRVARGDTGSPVDPSRTMPVVPTHPVVYTDRQWMRTENLERDKVSSLTGDILSPILVPYCRG